MAKGKSFIQRNFIISKKGDFARDFELRNQINGASGSVMDNIAEGFERGGNKEFLQFLSVAKGSSEGEVRSQLYRTLDREYISQNEFQKLYDMSEDISKLISKLMEYLQNSEMKGQKFKNR